MSKAKKRDAARVKDKHGAKNEEDSDSDDDDLGVPLGPGGSVLTPSPNPYNMTDRIKAANRQLEEEKKKLIGAHRTPKVRFIEPSPFDTIPDHHSTSETASEMKRFGSESKPSKVLLVTLPTAYSIDSEEILTEDDCEDNKDFTNDDFRGRRSNQELSATTFSESEEELEDITLPLSEETITSSLETVLYRSETEESELIECFAKSVNLNSESGLTNSVTFDDNNQPIECNDFISKSDEFLSNTSGIINKGVSKDELVLNEKISNDSNSAHCELTTKLLFNKSNTTVAKQLSKLKMNYVNKKKSFSDPRPSTAPVKRACCGVGMMAKLPAYNGLRSEYGLSKDQLMEREKKKYELLRALKMEKEKKYQEERQKQVENEIKFKNWLIKKKKESELKTLRRLKQTNYCFRTTPAPTSHLDKIGVLRKKLMKQENAYFLLDEIFKKAKPQEQKTYRIYLGLRV